MKAGIAAIEKQTEEEVRRPEEPAARVRPLRRARLDAGHDGHHPQPRAQRPDRRSARQEDRQPALRLGLLPPLRADVRRRRARRAEAAGRGSRAVRDGHRDAQARALSPGHRGHEAHRRGSEGARRPLQGAREGARRQELSGFAVGSADGRRRRRVRLLDERPRHRLSPQVQHPDRVGHRRQRAGDGLRQHRRAVRFRRRVHAQPGQRREGVLRRVPDQRAGRGRRRRRAHAGAGCRAEEADAEGVQRAGAHPPDARAALQGRAGLRVHHRRRRRLHAADAQRQAHGDGGAQVLDRHAQGEADRLEDGGDAQSGRPARTAAGAGVRHRGSGQGEGHRDRPARRSRRRLRTDLSERRSRGDRSREGREGPPRARRDVARGSARHDRRRRHPHRARRRVVARRARGAPDGQGLRLRRGRRGSGLPGTHGDGGRPDVQGRRLDVDRRHGRQGLRRQGQDRAVGNRRRSHRRRRGREEDREVQELPAADEVVRRRRRA